MGLVVRIAVTVVLALTVLFWPFRRGLTALRDDPLVDRVLARQAASAPGANAGGHLAATGSGLQRRLRSEPGAVRRSTCGVADGRGYDFRRRCAGRVRVTRPRRPRVPA